MCGTFGCSPVRAGNSAAYRRRDEWFWAVGCEAREVPDRRRPAQRRPERPGKTTLQTMVVDEAKPVGLQVAQGEQPLSLQPVGRALHSKRSTIDDMRVDHRRCHAGVAEQFLDGSDVIPVLEQVGRNECRNVWQRARLAIPQQSWEPAPAGSCGWHRRRSQRRIHHSGGSTWT